MMRDFGEGDITLCAHCGYAIRLNRHNWTDYETGQPYSELFWDHFVVNVFTCHTAKPKRSMWEVDHSVSDL